MGHPEHVLEHKHQIADDFWVRFIKNLKLELASSLKAVQFLLWLLCACLLGIFLFIFGFDLVKRVFAFIWIPITLYFVGTYLTLLPMYLVMIFVVASLLSLATSKPGESIVEWVSHAISSVTEAFVKPTSSSSLSQRLLGFVMLSALASLFLVFLI